MIFVLLVGWQGCFWGLLFWALVILASGENVCK